MNVKVRLYATLRRHMPGVALGQSVDVALPDNATVAILLDRLGIPHEELRICFVGGLYRTVEHPLQDGDDIALFPPVGGGEGKEG